jgi:hypothetical protein
MSNEYVLDAKEKIGPNPEIYIQKYISESVNHFSGETIRIEVEYEPNQVTNAILYDFAGENVNKALAPESLKTSVINELKSAVKHYK